VTNDHHLPGPLVLAALHADDGYDRGEDTWRSVTELNGPARAAALQHAHPDRVELEDVADQIARLEGKAMHAILEAWGPKAGALLCEQRLYATIGGKTISGQIDYLSPDGILQDWKTTSIFTVTWGLKNRGIKRTRLDEWEAQLNCYAYLATLAGHDVNGLEAVIFLDGWSRATAERDPHYPQAKVMRLPLELWDTERTQQYLVDRVFQHLLAETQLAKGIDLLHCTDEERWLEENPKKPPLAKRCLPGRKGYCPMRSYCAGLGDGQHRPENLSLEVEP
jgi:hypothetical protein